MISLKLRKAVLFGIIGVIIVSLSILVVSAKIVNIDNIKSFSYGYTGGYVSDANVEYTLSHENDGYIASIKPAYAPQEERIYFSVDESFANELEEILVTNKVGKWNGFDRYNRRVKDGDSFFLYITMMDGTELSAKGYMKWPRNYSAVKQEIEALFGRLQK